jgi:hypothetical protein
VVLNGGLAPVLAQLELWLGLRDHDEDETALSGSRGGAVTLLDRLRVTKSRNSLGGWDGILRLAIRGEGWLNETKEWSLESCETIDGSTFACLSSMPRSPALITVRIHIFVDTCNILESITLSKKYSGHSYQTPLVVICVSFNPECCVNVKFFRVDPTCGSLN